MARPSKLTPTQWDEIGKRIAGGESKTSLAKEYGIGLSTISERFTEFPKDKVRKIGEELATLPPSGQAAAVSLADDLRAISQSLASAGRYGSATAHRLQEIAHRQAMKIGDQPDMETLKGVAALTRTANEAASMGMGLLNANRDQNKDGPQPILIDAALSQT